LPFSVLRVHGVIVPSFEICSSCASCIGVPRPVHAAFRSHSRFTLASSTLLRPHTVSLLHRPSPSTLCHTQCCCTCWFVVDCLHIYLYVLLTFMSFLLFSLPTDWLNSMRSCAAQSQPVSCAMHLIQHFSLHWLFLDFKALTFPSTWAQFYDLSIVGQSRWLLVLLRLLLVDVANGPCYSTTLSLHRGSPPRNKRFKNFVGLGINFNPCRPCHTALVQGHAKTLDRAHLSTSQSCLG